MTTTELIELLKKNERGGATGRPREVMFEVDDRIIDTDGMGVTGSRDGLISELYLSLPATQTEPKTAYWRTHIFDGIMGNRPRAYMCGYCNFISFARTNYCPNCGVKMEAKNETD